MMYYKFTDHKLVQKYGRYRHHAKLRLSRLICFVTCGLTCALVLITRMKWFNASINVPLI